MLSGLLEPGLQKPGVPRRNSISTYSVTGAVRVLAPPAATLGPSSADALTAMDTSKDFPPQAQASSAAGHSVGPGSWAAPGPGPAVPRTVNSRRSLSGGGTNSRAAGPWRASDVSDLAASIGNVSLQGPRAGLAKTVAAVMASGKQWSERVSEQVLHVSSAVSFQLAQVLSVQHIWL